MVQPVVFQHCVIVGREHRPVGVGMLSLWTPGLVAAGRVSDVLEEVTIDGLDPRGLALSELASVFDEALKLGFERVRVLGLFFGWRYEILERNPRRLTLPIVYRGQSATRGRWMQRRADP